MRNTTKGLERAQSVPSFHGSTDSQNPHRNQCYCDLQIPEPTQTEKMPGAADQPVQTSQGAPSSARERVSKNKVGSD